MRTRHFSLFVLALLFSRFALAQGTISTVAGGNGFLDNIPATDARLSGPQAMAIDPQGNAYIGEVTRIRRVDAMTGMISTVAGSGNRASLTDGKATDVTLNGALFFAFDASGNLLFVDSNRVMKLDLQAGAVITIAGGPDQTTGQLGILNGLATDRAGNTYVTDDYNNKIYRIDALTKSVSRIAGIGQGPAGDGGPAIQASLLRPSVITLDAAGNIFFVEQYSLRRIDAQTGIITTIMPVTGYISSSEAGPVAKAALWNPTALTTDSKGNLYVADGSRILRIDWGAGTISPVAGSGQHQQFASDGVPALQADLGYATAISVDAGGNLWLADGWNDRLFVIPAATGLIRTVAGTSVNGDGGPALGALIGASGIAVNAQGDLFLAGNNSIRRVDHVTHRISTVAQVGDQNSQGGQITMDSAGNLFFAGKDRISRLDDNSGEAITVAGGHGFGFSGDGGLATAAQVSPSAVAVDPLGNLYIADYWNYRIRRVDAKTGIISTVAGNGQTPGQAYAGATGPASQIAIGVPTSIAISTAGDIYWTTPGRVLRMDSRGILSVAAGNGGCFYAGDGGPALQASLCQPFGLAFDNDGNLFVGETQCNCVRRIDAVTGLIQTVAGAGSPGDSGDLIPATQAALTFQGLTLAGTTLYIIDAGLNSTRIRTVAPAVPPAMPQPPRISQVAGAVDFDPKYSPGGFVSVMGNYLSSSPSARSAELGPDGRVTTTLSGDQVTFNGTAGPLLYVSAGQINAVVPYSGAPGSASVRVQTGVGADAKNVVITPTALAVFHGLVFNPDGSLNSATNPAPKGAILVLYGTGMGQTNPPGVDGAILQGPDFPRPLAAFQARVQTPVSQFPAAITYLGPLPGFIAGAVQINVRIPDSAPPGDSTLLLMGAGPSPEPEIIYMLSDPPVLTSIDPVPPIQLTPGNGNYLTLNGTNLIRIATVNFFLGGKPALQQHSFQSCGSTTACSVSVDFGGQTGDYSVEVVNAANQVSNRLTFTVK